MRPTCLQSRWPSPCSTLLSFPNFPLRATHQRHPFATAVTLAKSVKNAAELAGLREAHLRDGAALVRFLCWLDKAIASGARGRWGVAVLCVCPPSAGAATIGRGL